MKPFVFCCGRSNHIYGFTGRLPQHPDTFGAHNAQGYSTKPALNKAKQSFLYV